MYCSSATSAYRSQSRSGRQATNRRDLAVKRRLRTACYFLRNDNDNGCDNVGVHRLGHGNSYHNQVVVEAELRKTHGHAIQFALPFGELSKKETAFIYEAWEEREVRKSGKFIGLGCWQRVFDCTISYYMFSTLVVRLCWL